MKSLLTRNLLAVALPIAVLVGLGVGTPGAVGAQGTTTTEAPASEVAADKQISAKALVYHECDTTEWHFVITSVVDAASAPSSIHVTWGNGTSADVPLDKVTGKTAHYAANAHLDSNVTSATATIYTDWDGQFNLSHGPCGTPTTTTTTTTEPTTTTTTTEPTTTTTTTTTTDHTDHDHGTDDDHHHDHDHGTDDDDDHDHGTDDDDHDHHRRCLRFDHNRSQQHVRRCGTDGGRGQRHCRAGCDERAGATRIHRELEPPRSPRPRVAVRRTRDPCGRGPPDRACLTAQAGRTSS